MADELRFNGDEANIEHLARHAISTAEIEEAFANGADEIDFDVVNDEERWTSVGHTDQFRVLVTVWTMRGDAIRVVTAYPASKKLAGHYLAARGF